MRQINSFSFNRFFWLIHKELLTQAQSILFFSLTSGLLLFLMGLFGKNYTGNFHLTFYVLLLFGGGFWILRHSVLTDLHTPKRDVAFLTLPASSLEKFLSKLFLTSFGHIIGITLIFYLVSFLVSLSHLLISGAATPLFNPFTYQVWRYWQVYLICHALFFLGAVYFRKNAFSKTILVMLLALFLIFLFTLAVVHLFFHGMAIFSSGGFFIAYGQFMFLFFDFLLLPVCWILAYLRFTELEMA